LVPTQDARSLAEAMIELGNRPELRSQMGNAAREHIQAHFSLERMLDSYAGACL
jgi:glycosyltransferase involved in cell wall biosynthesis